MSTFNQIRGNLIKDVSSNPSNQINGDIWYNNTTGKITLHKISGTWSAGNACNTARRYFQGCGTQTDGIMAGGFNPGASPSPMFVATEEFNGSTWAEGNDINTARWQTSGSGTQTAGLLSGGNLTNHMNNVEEYNGTSWSEVNDLNTARRNAHACGLQTAALHIDGIPNSGKTEEYDGTNWTEVGDLNTARNAHAAGGTTSAAFVAAGFNNTANIATTEDWTLGQNVKVITD